MDEEQVNDGRESESFEAKTIPTFFKEAQDTLKDVAAGVVQTQAYIARGIQTFSKSDEADYNLFLNKFRYLIVITSGRVTDSKLIKSCKDELKTSIYLNEQSAEYVILKNNSSLSSLDDKKAALFKIQKTQMECIIKCAEEYIDAMYEIGILDINTKEILPFPFDSLIKQFEEDDYYFDPDVI